MTTPANTPMYEYLVEAILISISDEELDGLERFADAHCARETRRTLDGAIIEPTPHDHRTPAHAADDGASVPSHNPPRR